MVKRFYKPLVLVAMLLVGWSTLAHAQTLTATVDRNRISANETLTLTLRYAGGQAQSSPDFSGLRSQFDILSNQQSSQHSIINGKVSVSTEWSLMLAPKTSGQILIPPFRVEGQSSQPLTITVTSAQANPATGKDDVFVTTEVDKTDAFINEQLLVTFTLYYNQTVESLDKPEFEVANARVTELERVDYQTTIEQTRYGVAEYRYLVFPDTAGTLTIDRQTWTVRTTDQPNVGRFGLGMGRIKLYRPRTQELTVAVQPKPASYPANTAWLPATQVSLSERWSRDPTSMTLGEPITWTIKIDAEGVASEQLPPILTGLEPNGFKVYPDQPSHETVPRATGLSSIRTESVAIVPTAAGELTLPAVRLSWWDTVAGEVKVATLPSRTVTVTGAGASPSSPPGPTTDGAREPFVSDATALPETSRIYRTPWYVWLLLAIFALTSLVFGLLWWRSRRADPEAAVADSPALPSPDELLRLCDSGSALAIRQALLTWARQRWPAEQPMTLERLAAKCGDPALASQFTALDQALYGQGGAAHFDRRLFKKAIEHLIALNRSKLAAGALPPLYAV